MTGYAKIDSVSIVGIDAVPVEVEIKISAGMSSSYITVGLPDTAVKESKDRVLSAIQSSFYSIRNENVVVNLAPADLKKEGAFYDLPIALGILLAEEQIVLMPRQYEDIVIVGELSLDGRVRPVKGILSAALYAKKEGKKAIVVPKENLKEALVVDGLNIYPVETLNDAIAALMGDLAFATGNKSHWDFCRQESSQYDLDYVDVKGQEFAKRAMMIAAAGGHNLLMVGPPGSGKSMLAKRLPSILPEMNEDEALETTKIHSISGTLPQGERLVLKRPFRSPHHSISHVGLIGGGSYPKPGEVSLSHNGVLFLDELPEFSRKVLEVMRQPIEDGKVMIVRANTSVTYPCNIMLIAAMNPCPCGYMGHPVKRCKCSSTVVQKYLAKISGPLLDRIDIHIEVPAVEYKDVMHGKVGLSSAEMVEKISIAKEIQNKRYEDTKISANAFMNEPMIKKFCVLTDDAKDIMELGMSQMGLSARAYSRILKVARTIADLSESETIETLHVSEALQFRCLDKYLS